MENLNPGISCAFYTVKQLAALFGKSEDTIRRWKNEGVGKEEDNIKLRAVEREDGLGRKNARHLVFSREAVIEFVKANPFLMDDAPQLNMMMQAEGAWTGGAIPMPGKVGEFVPPENDDDSDEDEHFRPIFRRGEGVVSVNEDRDPQVRHPDFTRQAPRRPWNSMLSDFENSDVDDPVYHPKADPRTEQPDHRERAARPSFLSAFPPFRDDADEIEPDEDETSLPHDFDPFEGFDPFESFDADEARKSAGFGPLPREPRSRRSNAAEMKKRREALLYVSYVLSCHVAELQSELDDVNTSLRELSRGGIGMRSADTMRRMLNARRGELAEKIEHIEFFLEILEDE